MAPDHDVTDKVAAFDLALRGGFKLGILYREQRATLEEKYRALIDAPRRATWRRCSRPSAPARARRSGSRPRSGLGGEGAGAWPPSPTPSARAESSAACATRRGRTTPRPGGWRSRGAPAARGLAPRGGLRARPAGPARRPVRARLGRARSRAGGPAGGAQPRRGGAAGGGQAPLRRGVRAPWTAGGRPAGGARARGRARGDRPPMGLDARARGAGGSRDQAGQRPPRAGGEGARPGAPHGAEDHRGRSWAGTTSAGAGGREWPGYVAEAPAAPAGRVESALTGHTLARV